MANFQNSISIAARRLGYDSLKPKQTEAILHFLQGQDVFVSLPTGSGKSLCFFLIPISKDIILKKAYSTSIILIISPLSALMKDHVQSLTEKGMNSVCITKDFESTDDSVKECLHEGRFNFVYFSPESILCDEQWREMLVLEVYQQNVVGLVVDEAHLVVKWGESFRKEFANIGELRSVFPSVNMMALTATATKCTRKTICKSLGMKKAIVVFKTPNRSNIFYEVNNVNNEVEEAFRDIAEEVKVKRKQVDRTIIFCRSYEGCVHIYHFFRSYLGKDLTEPKGYVDECELRLVDMFSACTHPEVKDIILKQFRSADSLLRVIIATIAFGMGVDCPNVRRIFHWGLPPDIESYLQETGRAGRDGLPAKVVLFSQMKDCRKFSDAMIKEYSVLEIGTCRRKYLLSLFDQQDNLIDLDGCKCCDNCSVICMCFKCNILID